MEDARLVSSPDGGELAGCRTPEREECRIPATRFPPPAPRKKRFEFFGRGKREPPKKGYFHSPELDLFLAIPPRRQGAMA